MLFSAKKSAISLRSYSLIFTKKPFGAFSGNCDCQSAIKSFFITTKNKMSLIASAKLITCTALAFARFCSDAIAKDQLLLGFNPSLRDEVNSNRLKPNNIPAKSAHETNIIPAITTLRLNKHIKPNTVSVASNKCSFDTLRESPKLRRSTRIGGISNKSINGFSENITAQIKPVKVASPSGQSDAGGSVLPIFSLSTSIAITCKIKPSNKPIMTEKTVTNSKCTM